ncbi:unnamed protein product [Meganyctiphanes norvegica]|uniref:Mitochondrial splicing suppressor 51-like C-terminal domain-containing protein n=1 Tax=Meganyctiphanes norvegica TaxID=48144 RepID=A0AAV2PJH4_MEGNR
MANWYLKQRQQLEIPDNLLNEANLNDGLDFDKVSKLAKYSSERWLWTIVNLINERLAFPLTIYHALKKLKIGEERKCLYEITSLTIHIVYHTPMLDSRIWEFFLHQLPNLVEMNLTFTSLNMRITNRFTCNLQKERCFDCKSKQRVINYNTRHNIHYHEYFSSDDYVQPDVVAVFDIHNELKISCKPSPAEESEIQTKFYNENANRFTSQLNMTNSKDTIVLLTNPTEETFGPLLKSFYDARPVEVLLPVQKNPFCVFSTLRGEFDSTYSVMDYVCAIQRKQ